jgi:outer membrane protein assembly factor BamB
MVGLPLLAFLLLLLTASSASALITSLLPLGDMVGDSEAIFTARVETLDAEKRTMLLTAVDGLKGKAPFPRLPIVLTGDADAVKENQTPQLLERLAPGQTLVLFFSKRDKEYLAFAYTNGTWVQLNGVKPDGVDEARWSFGHFEPYLRRTFKGTTAEMVQTIKTGLETKKWPPVDKKEKPGLGPKVDNKQGAIPDARPPVRPSPTSPQVDRRHLLVDRRHLPSPQVDRRQLMESEPVLGVVVAPILLGPLSLLAMLFPSVFGGYTRWLAGLSVACTLLTLEGLHQWFGHYLAGTLWGSQAALWAAMTLCIVLGLAWSWSRHHERVEQGEAQPLPGRAEGIVLGVLCILGTGLIAYFAVVERQQLFEPGWMQALVMVAGCYGATAFVFWKRWRASRDEAAPALLLPTVGPLAPAPAGAFAASPGFASIPALLPRAVPRRPALATETVLLTTMAVAAVVFGLGLERRSSSRGGTLLETGAAEETPSATVPAGWPVRLPGRTAVSSSPLVAGNRVYLAADLKDAFRPSGAVFCLDRVSGQILWTTKTTKPVSISSPCLAGGRLFVGEGYHQDSGCKLYCLDAETGAEKWTFPTASHVESSPCVADGQVYFGAGDDGVYCVDVQTGKEKWHFSGFHVDASPVVSKGRLYVGSGKGDIYKDTVVVCLNSDNGKPVWQQPVNLPAWGSPTVAHGLVYFGLGNGTFEESESGGAAGALLCLRADDQGEQVFRYDVPDGVLVRPTVAGQRVYFGCRDSAVYAVDRRSGKLRWKRGLSSPVVTTPVVASDFGSGNSAVYVLGSHGQVYCLAADTGKELYPAVNLAERAGGNLDLWSSPALTVTEDAHGVTWQLFFGATLEGNTGLVYRLDN